MGGFEVAVVVLLVGGICQSFLNSKRFPEIFPALGHGVPAQTGMFLSGGVCSLNYLLVKGFDLVNLLGHYELFEVVVQLHYWTWSWVWPQLSLNISW